MGIPMNERHPRSILKKYVMAIPEPSQVTVPVGLHRHKLPTGDRISETPVLVGLRHEYGLEEEAA